MQQGHLLVLLPCWAATRARQPAPLLPQRERRGEGAKATSTGTDPPVAARAGGRIGDLCAWASRNRLAQKLGQGDWSMQLVRVASWIALLTVLTACASPPPATPASQGAARTEAAPVPTQSRT